MSKITLNITMNIDDTSEVDLAQKIDILRKNERLSEFCSQAIKQALDDPETCEDMNKKIKLNGNGILLDRKAFYEQTNKKLNYLEGQINALRYDMHTAAVLSDKTFYKELSISVLSTIDSLFQGIKNSVQLYPGDYLDTLRWKQRETELQNTFVSSLNTLRLVQSALDLDDDTEMPESTTSAQTEIHSKQLEEQGEQLREQGEQLRELTEKFETLLNGMTDIKEVLLNSDIILQKNNADQTTSTKQAETPVQNELPAYTPQEPVVYEEAPQEFSGDLAALADFFGGM